MSFIEDNQSVINRVKYWSKFSIKNNFMLKTPRLIKSDEGKKYIELGLSGEGSCSYEAGALWGFSILKNLEPI